MNKAWHITIVWALLAGLPALTGQETPEYTIIPMKPDPAIVADANLEDWSLVPNAITLAGEAHVTHGPDLWEGNQDLSGTIRLSWRPGMLAIAADVIDADVLQPYTGRDIWRGDHINLWIDFQPGIDPQRTMFGEGQVHVVVSPGNFNDIPPEIHVYRPTGLNPGPGEASARRTPTGYIVEAVIPVERLGCAPFRMHQDANLEVALSDADNQPVKQESLMTLGTARWVYSRQRMQPMVFGDGNGNAPPPLRGTVLAGHLDIAAGESETLTFEAPDLPAGKVPYIALKARFPKKTVQGFRTRAVSLQLNGEPVTGDRIANRPAKMVIMRGTEHTFVAPDGAIALYYTPDYFPSPQRHAQYGTIDGSNPTEYEFRVDGLLQTGQNTLTIRNLVQATEEYAFTAAVDEVEFRVKPTVPPPPPPKEAPTGHIPTIAPAKSFPKQYSTKIHNNAHLSITVGTETFDLQSRFSTPDGNWQSSSNPFFTHDREVIEHNEWLEVRDTFTNRTGDNLALMQEHTCDLENRFKDAWLAGLKMPAGNGNRSESDNPSLYATTGRAGIGMFAHNDAFIVHVNQVARDGRVSLNDHTLYLRPNAEYTSVLAVVPTAQPDFWQFVNAARRAREVNFPLRWCFAFMFHHWPVYEWTDETIRQFIDNKGANFVVQSNTVRNKEGRYARATDWLQADLSLYRDFQTRIRSLYPDNTVNTGIYYHCFLDTTRENDERFEADRGLDAAGNHMNYGGKGAYMHTFIPTLEPGHWGEVMAQVMDTILEDIGANGIFWDEFVRSRVPYVYGHRDGVSADIDPETHQITRLKGSMSLVSLPFRVKMVDRILGENRPFLINGAPHTRTMVEKRFMAFTETGAMSNCRDMLLHSPVALGDHLTEKKYADSYANMHAALDHGCLFVWYSHIFHMHTAPTAYYYPFTPIELHSGILIGEERIISNRSGYLGWGDNSTFEAHVFDREGREDPEFAVPMVRRNNATWADLRLPEGYMAILVREKK